MAGNFGNELKRHPDKFAIMCGAGVGMAISKDLKDWPGFVDQFAVKTREILNLNQDWFDKYTAELDLMAKIQLIECQLNVNWNGQLNPLEKHRMIAQLILRCPTLEHPERAKILHSLRTLILTTNYDSSIEDSIPRDRISISHIEALKYFPNDVINGGSTLGPGPFFQNPLERFIIHVHGRYFDIGPEHGFCLTASEYNDNAMKQKFLDFMTGIVTTKSLIFIGAKGTVEDEHFKALWETVTFTSKTHYILHRLEDKTSIQQMVQRIRQTYAVSITPICYGARDDLWTFLESIIN